MNAGNLDTGYSAFSKSSLSFWKLKSWGDGIGKEDLQEIQSREQSPQGGLYIVTLLI